MTDNGIGLVMQMESPETDSNRNRMAREAISDLFLDMDVREEDVQSIVNRLLESGLPWTELERIYSEEIAPLVYMNLRLVPGGVWGGFNINDLERRIGENGNRIRNWRSYRLFWKIYLWWITRETKDDWVRVRKQFHKQHVSNPDA